VKVTRVTRNGWPTRSGSTAKAARDRRTKRDMSNPIGSQNTHFTLPAALFLFFYCAGPAKAATVFMVNVNTSSINGLSGQIDLQFGAFFNSPNGDAIISSFTSDGGFSGSPTTSGTVIGGPLPATTTERIIGGIGADYLQNFTYGNFLQFTLSLGFTSPNPQTFTTDDTFGLALYDNSFNPQLSNGNEGDFIFTIDLHPNGTTTIHNASSGGQLTISSTPEPATLTLFGVALLAGIPLWRRRIEKS
jgi:hypothetical protein